MRETKNLLALIAFGGSGTQGEQKSKPVGLREWDGFFFFFFFFFFR